MLQAVEQLYRRLLPPRWPVVRRSRMWLGAAESRSHAATPSPGRCVVARKFVGYCFLCFQVRVWSSSPPSLSLTSAICLMVCAYAGAHPARLPGPTTMHARAHPARLPGRAHMHACRGSPARRAVRALSWALPQCAPRFGRLWRRPPPLSLRSSAAAPCQAVSGRALRPRPPRVRPCQAVPWDLGHPVSGRASPATPCQAVSGRASPATPCQAVPSPAATPCQAVPWDLPGRRLHMLSPASVGSVVGMHVSRAAPNALAVLSPQPPQPPTNSTQASVLSHKGSSGCQPAHWLCCAVLCGHFNLPTLTRSHLHGVLGCSEALGRMHPLSSQTYTDALKHLGGCIHSARKLALSHTLDTQHTRARSH